MRRQIIKIGLTFASMLALVSLLAVSGPMLVNKIALYDAYNLSEEYLKQPDVQDKLPGQPKQRERSIYERYISKVFLGKIEQEAPETVRTLGLGKDRLISDFRRGKHLGSIQIVTVTSPSGTKLYRHGNYHIASVEYKDQLATARAAAKAEKKTQNLSVKTADGESINFIFLPLVNANDKLTAIAQISINEPSINAVTRIVQSSSLVTSFVVALICLVALGYMLYNAQTQITRVEKANHLAKFDKLTELYHRKGFEEEIKKIPEGERVALALMDVDNFKSFNDQFGHLVGDAVLKHVADSMREEFGEQILCRWAGDEFIVLVRDAGSQEVMKERLQRLCDYVARPIGGDNSDVKCTTSIGAHIDGWKADGLNELIHYADAALYFAKAKTGKGQYYIYSPDLDEKRRRQAKIEYRLGKALQEDAMHLVYQPQYDVSAGKLQSLEAFLRWEDAELGNVGPNEFIPIAEKAGLILDLGAWALRRACREAATWPENVGISVNISAVEFEDPNFVEVVKSALNASGLAPERLEIELTETALLNNNEATTQTVTKVADLGVSIAIDGFGTGNASLTYLATLPVSTIKLHRFFIEKLGEDQTNDAIVNATIGLAKVLGITFVAQGIENAEQRQSMLDFGGTVMQGMFFGKPIKDPFSQQSPVDVLIEKASSAFKDKWIRA